MPLQLRFLTNTGRKFRRIPREVSFEAANVSARRLTSRKYGLAPIVDGCGLLIERIDFYQSNACTAVGSALDGGISSGRQVQHECRFQRIWRCECLLLDVDGVNIVLPVVVARDHSAARVVDRQFWIAQHSAHTVRSERWTNGAYDHSRTVYVSNDKPTDKYIIARADRTAGAGVRQLRTGFGREIVKFNQGNPLTQVLSSNYHGIGARRQGPKSG